MRLEMLCYLNELHKGIITLEVLANVLIQEAEAAPDEATADTLRVLARSHRVRVLEMQGQFAALKQDYSERYHRDA